MQTITANPVETIDLTPLIQEKALDYLGLNIVDLQVSTDKSIPDGYPRWQVYRHDRYLAPVSRWGGRHYHTRIITNPAGYATLYEAATCWVNKSLLTQIETEIEQAIIKQRNSLPDYF
ncbi:MAG: hypothetical protein ACRCZS_02410 [Chroococcidiopsis sp.]